MEGLLNGKFRSDWGEGRITVCNGRLVRVELPPLGRTATSNGRAVSGFESGPDDVGASERWVNDLEAYFRGERLSWSVDEVACEDLPIGEFRRAVYTALLSVPAGTTVTYGELAEMAGYPRAARAVGNAMAANPVPIVIPCHRVIRADGTLGNYGNDPVWKERLLRHEREHARGSLHTI